jgi:murein DD-endopeptidase MepM/ murein hydrolase activator NlpD
MPRVREAIAMTSAAVVFVAASVALIPPAGATIASDQAQIAHLKQHIQSQGVHIKALVTRYNAVQAQVRVIDLDIARDQKLIATDQLKEAAAMILLRSAAADAYVNGVGLTSTALQVYGDATTVTAMLEKSKYLGTVNDNLNAAVAAMHSAQKATEHDAQLLSDAQSRARSTLRQLASAKAAADAAITADDANLSKVNSRLQLELAAAAQAAEQAAAERAIEAWQKNAPHAPPVPIPPPSPGTYANPLRAIKALNPERIDMGVDFSGFGPIYALGDGIVLSTTIPGWPGGTYIAYMLTDGPANGLVAYAAEDIAPSVQVGDKVNVNTILGLMYPGPDGIETGWGDGVSVGYTMAHMYKQFNGSNTTAFGANFSELLVSLGAPGGVPQNNPPTGSLPRDWPSW